MGGYSKYPECPICGKKFVPAPFHAWKISGDILVCTYSCMRKYEKSHAPKRMYAHKGR